MDLAGLLIFASALFVAALSPGPAIAAIVARVLARGTAGAGAFCLGLAVGDVVWLTAAVFGLAFLAQSFALAFVALKYAGAAYLLCLAVRLWRAPGRVESAEAPRAERPLSLFGTGLALTLGNPKTMVFYLALLPNILDLSTVTPAGYGELVAAIACVLSVVFGGYVLLAARARRLLTSERAVRFVNRIAGTAMAGAAVAVASR